MRRDLIDMALDVQVRPFTADDVRKLRENTQSVRTGLALAAEFKQHEAPIMYEVVNDLFVKYPEKIERHKMCNVKARRDMKLVCLYCMYSIILNDSSYADKKLLWWLRTIFKAFEFGDDLISDAYHMVQRGTSKYLPSREAEAMNRMLDHAIYAFVFDPTDPSTHQDPLEAATA